MEKAKFYSSTEMKSLLDEKTEFQDKLYCRGFLITNRSDLNLCEYPFYGNWNKTILSESSSITTFLYTHHQINYFRYEENGAVFFLVGHAYNPVLMEWREHEILKQLSVALSQSEDEYWTIESQLTGVFCIGFVKNGEITYSTDCTGMQLIYYNTEGKDYYITSHSKLVADFCGYKQDDYIVRLVNSKFYKYWGTFLPGDLSPFKKIRRTQPNFCYTYSPERKKFSEKRYYPTRKIEEVSVGEYQNLLSKIEQLMENNMELIAKKWPNGRAAISVTGGKDSGMTLASAHRVYDQFSYFSYISTKAESVDADAAHKICRNIGVEHKIYTIPDEADLYKDIEIYKAILECNAGCIGHNNLNDVKKRILLDKIDDFDVEVKSWVDELSRAEGQNKYGIKKFPKKPTPGYYRCMWKVIVNPRLIHESNNVFREYLKRYYDKTVFSFLPWNDLFYWEFSWCAGEGMFLTSEHKFSYDITIPYNNRYLLELMFSVPFEKRLGSEIQIDTIRALDKRIEDAKAQVKNIAHTDTWTRIIRTYLKVFGLFNF